jgi:hypothetical protein
MTILQPYTKMASQGVSYADLRAGQAEPRIWPDHPDPMPSGNG